MFISREYLLDIAEDYLREQLIEEGCIAPLIGFFVADRDEMRVMPYKDNFSEKEYDMKAVAVENLRALHKQGKLEGVVMVGGAKSWTHEGDRSKTGFRRCAIGVVWDTYGRRSYCYWHIPRNGMPKYLGDVFEQDEDEINCWLDEAFE